MLLSLNGWRTALLCVGVLYSNTAWSEDITTTNRFIIRYAPTLTAMSANQQADQQQQILKNANSLTGLTLQATHTLATGDEVLRSQQAMTLEAAHIYAETLQALPGVASVEPDVPIQPSTLKPSDTLFNQQTYLADPYGMYLSGINVEKAWALTASKPITVGVLDTGITDHPDLTPNLMGQQAALSGYDFINDENIARDKNARDPDPTDEGTLDTTNWHGTHVAGLIAAVQNQEGISGVSPHAQLLNLRIMGANGGYTSDLIDAIYWAIGEPVINLPLNTHPARIINLSLGGKSTCSPSLQQAIDTAVNKGTVIIVAAGNAGIAVSQQMPANCERVIVVGAVDYAGQLASFSNRGEAVDLVAPGVDIISTFNSGYNTPLTPSYNSMTGTSMSTALVTGVVALMLSANDHLINGTLPKAQLAALIEAKLKQSTRPFTQSAKALCANQCGAGLLDAALAVKLVSTPPTVTVSSSNAVANATVTLTSVATDDSYNTQGLVYSWQQLTGETVVLTNSTQANATFKAPANTQTLVFRLTVTDDVGLSTSADITLDVKAETPAQPTTPTQIEPNKPSTPNTSAVTPPTPEPATPSSSTQSGGGGGSTSGGLLVLLALGYAVRRATNF